MYTHMCIQPTTTRAPLHQALRRARRDGAPVPTLSLDLRRGNGLASGGELARSLEALETAAAAAEVVLVKLSLPAPEPRAAAATRAPPLGGGRRLGARAGRRAAGEWAAVRDAVAASLTAAGAAGDAGGARLLHAMAEFQHRCPELTDRSKRRKRECTNVC